MGAIFTLSSKVSLDGLDLHVFFGEVIDSKCASYRG